MYNTVIGVGAAVLAGGVALYTGYHLTRGDGSDGNDAAARTEVAAADRATERAAAPATERGAARADRGRGGVPDSERALDFAEGAAGDRILPEGADAERAERAARDEAARLAALGEGGVVDGLGADDPGLDDLSVGDLNAGDLDVGGRGTDALADARREGDRRLGEARDGAAALAADAREQADGLTNRAASEADRLAARAGQEGRDAIRAGADGAEAAADGALRGGLRGAVSADAADRRALSTEDAQDADLAAVSPVANGAQDAAVGAAARTAPGASRVAADGAAGASVLRTASNPRQTDKPDLARNTPLVDKPDTRLARLVAKPDNSPSFAASDPGRSFDPCMKADGTPYAGPGTAINPFADGDPCLPKATGQSFEVAAAAPPRAPVTASTLGQAAPRILPFVDLVRPGFVLAPPVGGNFGSDYGN